MTTNTDTGLSGVNAYHMKFKNPFRGLHFQRRLLAAELAVIVVAWVAYILFGAAVVSFIYQKGLIKPLQAVADHSAMVAHYVERADGLVLALLAVGFLVIGLQTTVPRLWKRARDRARTAPISSAAPPIASGRRYVIFGLLATLLGCSLSLGILVASNRLFVHQLSVWKELNNPSVNDLRLPRLTERQVLNLGWAHRMDYPPPLSSYIYHSMAKPSGTYRIGAYGDSFTEGEETALGQDFPSFLQEQLQAVDGRKYEVINFGLRGYGIQQSFLMYEYLGKQYNLDAALFMPSQWLYDRDNTFKLDGANAGGMHARYILTRNGFRLVTIDEKTRREAMENYYRILPPIKYWLYDAKSANLVSTFAASGDVPRFNPFYYQAWRGYHAELQQLYSRMFAKAADELDRVMVVGDDNLIELLESRKHPRIMALKTRLNSNSFLLRAPRGHLSALGNQLRAAEITEWLTGQKLQIPVPTISVADYRPTGEEESLLRISLAAVSEAWLEIEGRPVAGFFMYAPNDPSWRMSRKANFEQQGIRGIIQLQGGEKPAEKPIFVPVDFPVPDGARLELRISSSGSTTMVPIGKVDCVASSLCRARFDGASKLAQIHMDRDGKHITFAAHDQVSVRNGYFDAIDVLVSGRPMLRGQRQNRFADLARRFVLARSLDMLINKFELKPLVADYLFLRAEAGHYVNTVSIPRHGLVQMVLRRKDGTVLHLGSFLQYAIS